MSKLGQYRKHVSHPRYGYAPRVTGKDGPTSPDGDTHWRYAEETMIPRTAVKADMLKQYSAFPLAHYYDLDKVCTDCRRPFIFFAVEQKHWYEVLGFPLDSRAVRCPECRKRDQRFAKLRQRYDALLKQKRSWEECIELADAALTLVESGAMRLRDFSKLHRFLNEVPERERYHARFQALVSRLKKLEKGKQNPAASAGR
jgi:hypothetical protein